MSTMDILARLNAMSSEIADTTDSVLASMSAGQDAMRKLNDLQNGLQFVISLAITGLRNSSETIPVEFQNSAIVKSPETGETDEASRHGPQAQDSRETVTPAGELDGGVGDGTDAGEAVGDAEGRAAQSAQAVAETAPVDAGAAPDARATDQVLDLHQTGEITPYEIASQLGYSIAVVSRIVRRARRAGEPRAVRGDLRRAEIQEARDQAVQAPSPAVEADATAAPPAGDPEAAPQEAGEHRALVPTKVDTIRPTFEALGTALALVSIRQGLVENDGQEARLSGAPLRVIAKLNDQNVYSDEELAAAGRYVSAVVFRKSLNDIQRVLSRVGLHIVEFVGGGFQLRRVA